jgi:hypothetical protein
MLCMDEFGCWCQCFLWIVWMSMNLHVDVNGCVRFVCVYGYE